MNLGQIQQSYALFLQYLDCWDLLLAVARDFNVVRW